MKKKVFSLMMTLVLAFMGVARAQAPSSYTFDFENGGFQGWTTIDANHDGYDWMTTSSLLNAWGINLFGGYGHDGSQYFLASQSRDFWHLFFGLEHDNYLVSPRVTLGGSISFWATSRADLFLSEEHFGVAVSTTNNYDPNAFTMVDEWTIHYGEPVAQKTGREVRSIYFGTWYEYTVDLSAFSGEGYVAIRHFGDGQWMFVVDDITLVPGEGEIVPPVDPEPEPAYVPGLHTLAYYGVGDYERELIDLLYIERPNGAWMEPYHFNLYNDGDYDVEVVLIDFLHNNGYFSMIDDDLYNFTVENNGRPGVDLFLTTNINWTSTDVINSLLAVNTTERSTHLFNIIAVPYQPYCPDVVEKAYNIGTVTTGTTWHMYASEMWNEVNPEVEYNLHDNYTLPFPEIPEGYDAVMKFTADHDIMLNAYVSDGANGKVALYREDFAGRPGPMADNNYTMRPFNGNGGGAPVAPSTIDFETGNFSQFGNYTNDATYPWYISADAAYTGNYGMMSGNAGVNESASIFTATVNYTTDGTVSFDFFASGESGLYSIWDKCVFQIDGEEMFRYGEENVWDHFSAEVAAGEHTFTWIYEKDYSLAAGEDCFKVDNIVFEGGRIAGNRDEYAYDFENDLEGWTNIDNDGDGIEWMMVTDLYSGVEGHGANGSDNFVMGVSYVNGYGAFDEDNYLVSPQAYALENSASLSFYHDQLAEDYPDYMEVCVATAATPSASDFTSIWNNGGMRRSNRQGRNADVNINNRFDNWQYVTLDLSAYAGQNVWIAFHHQSYDQYAVLIDDVVVNTGTSVTPVDPTPGDDPTPVDPTPVDPEAPVAFSAGPVIENLNVLKGTYYLVASSTDPDFEVTINYEELPCPIAAVTNIYPADNAWGISPNDLILRWRLNDYANEWRLVFSSTYWPEDEIDTEHPATFVTEWSSNLQESFNISAALEANGYQLWNNTNYFWRIDQRSNPGTEWECYTQGPVFGFTTTFNYPQHLTATNTRIFEYEETVTLSWDPIVDRNNDRTYRRYRVYMDGERVYDTPDNVVTTSWDIPQDLLTYNMYNEHGYVFEVTAVYDEGESPKSNAVEIWVSGNGNVSGTAYEQDGVTPIGGVTVTIQGFNEFNAPETYTFITDENGYYEGPVHAGQYPIAVAQKEGYQDAITVHPLPLDIVYQELTDHVDFIMDELFLAPAHVCAEPIYVPGVQGDTLVQVWWDFNFFTELRENFEDWDNTPFAWQNDATYPWTLTTDAHEGTYALKSGNAGVTSSSSAISVTVNIPQDGMFSFEYNCQGEGSYTFWDHCDFVMDGNTIFSHGADLAGWQAFSTPITAGTHSFTWSYTKDSSVNPTGDCFTIDNIVFVGHPEDVENSRALHHYNIYRTDCYNDGPYTDENTTFLATVWRPDTSYFDVNWPEVPTGVYKYGVSAVYRGNYPYNPNNPRVEYPNEERESEIVWHTDCKPCIDKDMYLNNVSVNVVLNSADSPEGTVVSFLNLMPGEQLNHPQAPITLDATGHYVFPTFRKGTYLVTVSLPGYETLQVEEPIWTDRELRYVLTEIIYSVKNVYVSRTGWAMWQPITPDDQPAVLDFENGFGDFEFVNDAEYPWTVVQEGPFHTTYCIKSGNAGVASSTSAIEATVDYIEAGQIKFDALCQGEGLTTAWDKCMFYIDGEAQFTHGAEVAGWNNYRFNVAQGTHTFRWEYSKDSSVNPDGDCFKVDNINFGIGYTTREERHLEGYKIMCTSIDDEPIFNHDTPADQPFCQLTTVDPWSGADVLIEGERYKVKVCAIYSTGQSAWSEAVIWQYEPCEHWGPVDEVTVGTQSQGNHIEWVFEHGHNQWVGPLDPDQPQGDASSFSYDCEDGMPEGWTNIDADGDGNVWVSSMTPGIYHNAGVDLTGTGHNESVAYVISGSYANQTYQALTPDNYLVSPQVTLGGTFSFWACGQDDSYCHEHFGVAVSTTGNTNAADFTTLQEWTIAAKGQGAKTRYTRSDSMRQTTWTQYTVDLSAYAGQTGYVAIRHFNCTDEFILNVDDIEMNVERGGGLSLVSGGAFYNQYAEDGVTLNFLALDNVDLRAYLLYNISKDSRFSLTAEAQYGQFVLTPASDMNNFMEEFESFYQDATYNFSLLSKYDILDRMNEWKSGVASQNYLSITMDVALRNARVENDQCINSLPFCTSDLIEFEAASTSSTAQEEGMDDGCIGSSYNPSFYHMRIHTSGPFVIHMEGHDPNNASTTRDIDFCMWGPYTEQEITSGYACTHLTGDKIMDCCYSASYTEDVYLGYPEGQHQHNTSHGSINYHEPQVGEYYVLMITNYSQQPCVIDFTKTEGEGETDCDIVVPSDIIGFLITQDGEYLDIVGPDVREYDHLGEFGEHVYCVRPIYPGPQILSDTNYYFSMGCPVCMSTNGEVVDECEAGAPLFAEVNNEFDQVHLYWAEQPEPPTPEEYSSFAEGFEGVSGQEIPADWTTIDADGDGNDWYTLNWIEVGWDENIAHGGDTWATSASYTSSALYPDNYLVSPQVTLGGTLTFWACAQDASWAAEHFGVAISTSGNTNASDFTTIQEWTMTAKGLGAMTRDTRDGGNRAGTWYQYTVDLSDYAGMTGYIAIRHFNCTDMFRLNIDDVELNVRGMGNRDGEIVAYNIYRSVDGVEYELIGTVDGDVTEYFDAPEAGTYYYQVTAVYADGCESEPAISGIDPEVNYVMVGVTGIGENSDNVNLFPNPTKGNVTIQAKGMERITVVSVLGQVVFDTELDQDEYILNMAQFNTGMYMVRVYTNEGVTVKRVTVMH